MTFLPLPPLFNLPSCIAFISRSTLLPASGEYLRELDLLLDVFADAFFAPDFAPELVFVELFLGASSAEGLPAADAVFCPRADFAGGMPDVFFAATFLLVVI